MDIQQLPIVYQHFEVWKTTIPRLWSVSIRIRPNFQISSKVGLQNSVVSRFIKSYSIWFRSYQIILNRDTTMARDLHPHSAWLSMSRDVPAATGPKIAEAFFLAAGNPSTQASRSTYFSVGSLEIVQFHTWLYLIKGYNDTVMSWSNLFSLTLSHLNFDLGASENAIFCVAGVGGILTRDADTWRLRMVAVLAVHDGKRMTANG